MFGVAQDAAKCLGQGALHDRTMIFLALPDYGQNLRKVQLTSQWVKAIGAAIKTVHSAGVLHNDLVLHNFVGNSPDSVKLIDFACCATSGFSSETLARQEKQFMESLVVQVSFASHSLQSVSTSLALSLLRLCIAIEHLCLAVGQLYISTKQLASRMKHVCDSHCQACTMCPSCVEVTPKLTTCAIGVDSAAGLKQPGERSVVTRRAQKSLRAIGYQDSALGAQPCSICNITCDVLILCTTFQITYDIAARYLPLDTLQPYCHMLCIVMHALLPSIAYIGKVESCALQRMSSLLLTATDLLVSA